MSIVIDKIALKKKKKAPIRLTHDGFLQKVPAVIIIVVWI